MFSGPQEGLGSDEMDKVELIPWDPANDEHIKRLYDQRVACEWHHEMISQWSEDQREGSWAMYWIVGLPWPSMEAVSLALMPDLGACGGLPWPGGSHGASCGGISGSKCRVRVPLYAEVKLLKRRSRSTGL